MMENDGLTAETEDITKDGEHIGTIETEASEDLNSVEQSDINSERTSIDIKTNTADSTKQSVDLSLDQSIGQSLNEDVQSCSNSTSKEGKTGAFHEIEAESKRETYETEFEKFLRQANERNKESDSEMLKDKDKDVDTAVGRVTMLRTASASFDQTCEETSNSSWYKMKSDGEEKMDTSENVTPPDENSNLSLPDNGSVASSNIGDSCMSFQDQGSNMDEGSNLSIPGDNSIPTYAGHQPVFDESANMNPPSNVPFARPDTPTRSDTPGGPGTPGMPDASTTSRPDTPCGPDSDTPCRPGTPSRPDTPGQPDTPGSATDANSDNTPVKRYRRGTMQIAAEDANEHGHGLTASDVFEYQWPQEKDSEYFMLQEQISMYLDVKSFKRKYPDLFRRVCDKQEKDFLRGKGVVSETQSDLGLTALKADEVHDLLGRDYPAKYKEFLKVLREREKQKMADKMKEFHALKLEKNKMIEYTKRAMKSVSDWNRELLKKKNEQRRAYFDMQTFTVQYPKSKYRKLEQSQTEVSAYPLTLIPGQFQDFYRKYSQEELKYYPLNTSLFDPPKKVDASAEQEADDDDDSQADDKGNDSGSDSDDSSSSSSDDDDDDDDNDGEKKDGENADDTKKLKKEKSLSREASKEKSAERMVKQENKCRICKDESAEKQKATEHEELIACSECKGKGHPTCLDLNADMVRVIKTYPWQCMECKTCVQCMDPFDEDKMLFCDKCDRGYHTFCVGLKSLPMGQWDCFSCRGDTTPIKPLPKPPPKAKRGRKPGQTPSKPGQTPGKPGRPRGRPPKDPNKAPEIPTVEIRRDTPGRDRRRKMREESDNKLKDNENKDSELDTPVKEQTCSGDTESGDNLATTEESTEKRKEEIENEKPVESKDEEVLDEK